MKYFNTCFLAVLILANFNAVAMYDAQLKIHGEERWIHDFAKALVCRNKQVIDELAENKKLQLTLARKFFHVGAAADDKGLLLNARKYTGKINEYLGGLTPLSLAAVLGHDVALTALLDYGANVNLAGGEFNVGKDTALHLAASAGRRTTVELLVKANAHINAINDLYLTPLMLAAQYGFADVVDYLISSGANKEQQSRNGDTALAFAAKENHQGVILLLLKHGARKDVLNNDDLSPHDLAKLGGHAEILKLLATPALRRPVFVGSPKWSCPGSPPALDLSVCLENSNIDFGPPLLPEIPPSPGSGSCLRLARQASCNSETPPGARNCRTPLSASAMHISPFNWSNLRTVAER